MRASDDEGAWQLAEVGDATGDVFSQTNVVVAHADNRVLSGLRVEPQVFTPNDDGVNDETALLFSVNRVMSRKEIILSVYDLSGRIVRRLRQSRPDPRGSYAVPWRGDDDNGKRVPPGTYFVRLQVFTESERAEGTLRMGTVSVAY